MLNNTVFLSDPLFYSKKKIDLHSKLYAYDEALEMNLFIEAKKPVL